MSGPRILYWPTEHATRLLHGRACRNCQGQGELHLGPLTTHCPDCQGAGWVAAPDPILGDFVDHRCPTCQQHTTT